LPLLNESWTSLAAAVVVLAASFVGRGDVRRLVSLVALGGLLVAMLQMPLHVSIPEGDYRTTSTADPGSVRTWSSRSRSSST